MPSGLPAPVTSATLPSSRRVTGASSASLSGSSKPISASGVDSALVVVVVLRGRRAAGGRGASRRGRPGGAGGAWLVVGGRGGGGGAGGVTAPGGGGPPPREGGSKTMRRSCPAPLAGANRGSPYRAPPPCPGIVPRPVNRAAADDSP